MLYKYLASISETKPLKWILNECVFADGPFLEDNSPTKSPPEHHDETLLLTSDSLPIFLEEPQDSYVVKNRPAVLKCRAAHALKVYFKCNGAKNVETSKFDFVDPQTGVRVMEAETNVTRDMVEEFFGKDKFKCECHAWSGRGSIKSQSATIDVACEYFLAICSETICFQIGIRLVIILWCRYIFAELTNWRFLVICYK